MSTARPKTNKALTRRAPRTSAIVRQLLEWFANNARPLPWRQTRDPYAIWVSEIMLQQTQVATVMRYWSRWMNALPNVRALARARPTSLHKLWEGMGYYRRVENMQKAARIILEKHHGEFPTDFAELLELPGIGRYTAGAICSIAFNQPTPILDGNVIRVLARLFALDGNPHTKLLNDRFWALAEKLVHRAAQMENPNRLDAKPSACSRFNQSLMELGALICLHRQPRCHACPVASDCLARRHQRVSELPRLTPRPQVTHRKFVAFISQRSGRFLVRQRPPGIVNAQFWEFPNIEIQPPELDVRNAARTVLGHKPGNLEPLCTIRHSITRYRITLEVFRVTPNGSAHSKAGPLGRWLSLPALARLPFSSAHKRILQHLELQQRNQHSRRWRAGWAELGGASVHASQRAHGEPTRGSLESLEHGSRHALLI